MALVGEPKPKCIIHRNNISNDDRLIEMRNGNLDMIHDLSPEGTFSIMYQDPQVQGWFPGFPYAHPDPTLVMAVFNHQNPLFADKLMAYNVFSIQSNRYWTGWPNAGAPYSDPVTN